MTAILTEKKFKSYESQVENILETKREALENLAEEIRTNIIIPACKKYKLNFCSGMGTWFFYRHGPRSGKLTQEQLNYDVHITNQIDAEDAGIKTGLMTVFDLLHLDLDESCRSDIGIYVRDVNYETDC